MIFKLKVPTIFKSVRYSMIALNGIFLTTGILLILAGVIVLVIYSDYSELVTKRFFTLPSFVIATGVIICLSSILGFFGAVSKNFYAIALYVLLLVFVLIFEIAIIIFSFNIYKGSTSAIRSTMAESLQEYETKLSVAKIWDDLQMDFECCGVTGRNDWGSSRIPVSCCHIDYGTISPFVCTTANAYATGCASALGDWLSYNAYVIAVTGSVVISLQIIITLVSGWLAWRTKNEEIELES